MANALENVEKLPTFDGTRYGVGGIALPSELAQRRLPYNPNGRLPIEEPRFVPKDNQELLSAIFTWWELLDGLMLVHEPRSRFMAGYIREVQMRRMLQLVRAPNVSHYCEGATATPRTLVFTGAR